MKPLKPPEWYRVEHDRLGAPVLTPCEEPPDKAEYVETLAQLTGDYVMSDGTLDSCSVSHRANLLRELAGYGRVEITFDDGHRRVKARWSA